MRKVRFLNLAVTLGLVVGLFAAAIGTASAFYGPGMTGTPTLYFPWVANGDEADGSGPWYSTVTIQNTEIFKVRIDVSAADGTVLAGNVLLNPRASKTWTAAALGVAAPGSGVKVTAQWDPSVVSSGVLEEHNYCGSDSVTITRSDIGGVNVDRVDNTVDATNVASVEYGGTTYVEGTDYTAKVTGSFIEITWLSGGARPAADAVYTVNVVTDCATPRIAGVEKHATPALGGMATTNATTVSVDGYSAVSNLDVSLASGGGADLEGQSRWVVPIVQTNSGWNTLLYVTNVSGSSNVGVTGTFYKASGQGYAGPSTMSLNMLLGKGQTAILDLTNDAGFPAGTVGSLWLDGDGAIVAQVYRVKAETAMALTTVAQPRNDNDTSDEFFGINPNNKYAPLVFRDYNGWNTGINIANLASHDNQVTVTYFNYSGNIVGVESKTIPPRAMEVVYKPAFANSNIVDGQITSARISGTEALAAAIDEVKYLGGQGSGHAMSYGAGYDIVAALPVANYVDDRYGYISKLALPLVQKGDPQTGTGDTSGINLFNPNQTAGVTAYVQFLDTTGVPVAPTVAGWDGERPIQLPMGALSGATVYTMDYSEMPAGFTGSAVIGVVHPALTPEVMDQILEGDPVFDFLLSSLVGVSNNVNYGVEFDGSAAFNLSPAFTYPPSELFNPPYDGD